MIKLDGSYLEGGGQIARTALALSTITQKPFEINNIRKGRQKPGLKAQHLTCVKALELLCNAKTEGASLGSEHISYTPGKIEGKTINVDIGTSGSIGLLLQAVLLPCFFAEKTVKLNITGGSEGKGAMPYDYFKEILVPQIRKFCEKIDVKLIKRGYFPKGSGKVSIEIKPAKIDGQKIELLEQGNLIQIKGVSHASLNLEKAEVAERQAKAAKSLLARYSCPVEIRTEYCDTLSPGSGIALWAIFSKNKEDIDEKNPIRLGADALGELGKKAEIVGKEAAQNLIREIESKAPVDKHLADQILPFMALTKESTIKVSEITNHCRTNIYIIERFLGKIFDVNEKERIISVNK